MKRPLAPLAGLSLAAGLLPNLAAAQSSCALNNGPIKHVVFLEFDNVHQERDHPLVPSDLEQLPALRNFLLGNGVLALNNTTSLISHTADDIVVSETGVYPDRLGTGISNSFGWYGLGVPKQINRAQFTATFAYWTDPVSTRQAGPHTDTNPIMINENGRNAPAPWPVFTEAGCDVGVAAIANMDLENSGTDVANVFGANSQQSQESNYRKGLDFEGIAVHCANSTSTICASQYGAPGAYPDLLPDEPGGYSGYKALFGHKYVAPAIANGAKGFPDLTGAPINGFPGYDGMEPKITLAYAAQMLEAGVPVIFGYMADAHDNHAAYGTFGPGESGYEQQLANYNQAFATFFARLTADGITPANTLFLITTDEQDYFSGGQGAPAGCNGVRTPCTYVRTEPGQTIGEVDYDLGGAVAGATGNNITFFDAHYDVAPNFYIFGNAPTPYGMSLSAQPGPLDPSVRGLEHTLSTLQYPDPYTGNTVSLNLALADQAEMKLLHMTSSDPQRTPNFTMFAYPNTYDLTSTYSSTQTPCTGAACASPSASYAWEHGGIADQVSDTWVGLVGPNVQHKGQDKAVFSDHADFRPTILALAGLTGAYVQDGRVLAEYIAPASLPPAISGNLAAFTALAAAYKQLNAPFGAVSTASLKYANPHIANPEPTQYQSYLETLGTYTQQRDTLAGQMKSFLDGVEFHGATFDTTLAAHLTQRADTLIKVMTRLSRGQ